MGTESAHGAHSVRNRAQISTNGLTGLGTVWALWVHVVDRGERDVWGIRGLLDRVPAAGKPVEHGDDADDLVAFLAQPLERVHRRAAGRDDVLDDQAALAGLERRPLQPTLEPVLLA